MGDPRAERMHVGDNTLWSIGEVARKTGLSVKLIRHWSDAGVVHPAGRTPAGYRLYDTEALARLQLAQTLRGGWAWGWRRCGTYWSARAPCQAWP
ncbi:MerR family DNA-binding transcriptional regulator [Streptomyces sp. NPDC049627]|uniref:helix-turn-helix domain-containing protein n=1 Tax=Streptomyces sp. NPDC049627 TaxID=3365595 RepID=UPI0037976875